MDTNNEAGTADAGTQAVEDSATNTGTAVADTQAVEAAKPETADSQSSTNEDQKPEMAATEKQEQAKPDTANQWDTDQNPYRKRFNDTLSHAQRLYQEKQERDRQFSELQTKIAEYESKTKAQAEAAKLNRWNKGHPEHNQFRSLQERADFSRKLLANAQTPEDQAAARRLMAGQFSAEELQELENSERDRKNLISEFSADPRGFITSHVQDAVRAAISEYDAYQRASSQVTGMINDPNNSKLIESYAPDMARIMDPNVPSREKAFEYAKLRAENDQLRAQVGQRAVQAATADARTDALNGRKSKQSRQQHDDDGEDRSDARERLSKRGIKPGDSRFAAALADELLRNQRA